MLLALLRVVFGFAIACLAAALVQRLFAFTPGGVTGDPDGLERLLLTATHFAVFSSPFALLVAAIGEWQGFRGWLYYAAAGLAIAISGLLVQYAGEGPERTIWNTFALQAFLATGLAGGLTYWLMAGRRAGGEPDEEAPEEPMPEHFKLRGTVVGPPIGKPTGDPGNQHAAAQ
jgi:hypothetical protein